VNTDSQRRLEEAVAAAFGPTANGAEIVATIERLARGPTE
jgi:hypothetical protein